MGAGKPSKKKFDVKIYLPSNNLEPKFGKVFATLEWFFWFCYFDPFKSQSCDNGEFASKANELRGLGFLMNNTNSTAYSCSCLEGFSGTNCQNGTSNSTTSASATTEANACDCLCQNNGICLKFAKIESFCFCPSQYRGKHCEVMKADTPSRLNSSSDWQVLSWNNSRLPTFVSIQQSIQIFIASKVKVTRLMNLKSSLLCICADVSLSVNLCCIERFRDLISIIASRIEWIKAIVPSPPPSPSLK